MSGIETEVLTTSIIEDNTSQGKGWVLDSGSAVHICSHKKTFDSYVGKEKETVKMVDGSACKVIDTGKIKIKGKDGAVRALEAVWYVPEA